MTIADPLRNARYVIGRLLQQCEACGRRYAGHNAELIRCPDCAGNNFGRRIALEFGGLLLVYDGTRFRLHPNCDSPFATIDEADIGDSLRFLCLHGKDFRPPDARIADVPPQRLSASDPAARHLRRVWDW
jgi:hypothetical protein